ncbi:hypothetical protein DFH94DRAFT_696033 [Russula ochroleuca]|uniref:Uncharacterized protein n=1 Tax=Russula ochroleuca TaxID=152965 RepID=A0A9P5JYY8_9AGAM|nr:hypothetical protein DFH94DRAFT_696033 [Russula ochroleuca]
MVRHIKDKTDLSASCECASIPSHTTQDFWEAMASVVEGCFEKAESALSLMDPEAQIGSATSLLEPFDIPDANLIM